MLKIFWVSLKLFRIVSLLFSQDIDGGVVKTVACQWKGFDSDNDLEIFKSLKAEKKSEAVKVYEAEKELLN